MSEPLGDRECLPGKSTIEIPRYGFALIWQEEGRERFAKLSAMSIHPEEFIAERLI